MLCWLQTWQHLSLTLLSLRNHPSLLLHRSTKLGAAKTRPTMGLLALWDDVFAKVRANEKLHLAWCCTGVIGCLVVYGVLQARPPSIQESRPVR